MNPHVSIIVPVFNAGRYLEQALRSTAAQTYRDFEVVVVDDGSTDRTTLALLEAARRQAGVTVHRTPNCGPAAARNTAIEHARGGYILPLDADDWLAPTFLAKTVPVLDANPEIGICYTWVGLVGGHTGIWRTGDFSLRALLSRCTVHVSALYRRELWAEVGGYDPRFVESWEDWDFWIGAATRGWQARCVPEVLMYYRRSPTSREPRARAPGVGARLMRTLIDKHRALYAAHFDDALADLYEHYAATCLSLERVYTHPVLRAGLRLRDLVRRRRPG
jgi:glycosyltransferase involved in cell wall biosynthesis